MRYKCLIFAATLSLSLVSVATAAPDASLARLQQQLEFVAHASDGVVGMSAVHLESRRSVSVRGTEGFPMASAFKIPIAIQLMKLVDEGKLNLDKMASVTQADLHPGSGELTELFFHPGLSLS